MFDNVQNGEYKVWLSEKEKKQVVSTGTGSSKDLSIQTTHVSRNSGNVNVLAIMLLL